MPVYPIGGVGGGSGGSSIPASNTIFVDVNGSDTSGQIASSANPFQTLVGAFAAATNSGWSGGLIKFGPGTFSTGQSQWTSLTGQRNVIPAGFTMSGAGKLATTVQFLPTASITGSRVFLSLGTGCAITDMTVSTLQGSSGSGIFIPPIGSLSGGGFSVSTNWLLRNLLVLGDIDCLLFGSSTSSAVTGVVYDCDFQSASDTCEVQPGGTGIWTVDIFNSRFAPVYASYSGEGTLRSISLISISSGSIFRAWNCLLTPANAASSAPVTYGGEAAAGTLELHDCYVSASSTYSGTTYDLYQSGSGTLNVVGTRFATSSGTISQLSEGVAGSAPSTASQAVVSTVYGTSGTLLGTPRAWQTVVVNGTSYSVPLF